MLNFILLAGSLSVIVSAGDMPGMDCVGKEDDFQFFQECNECWCWKGKTTCTNKGCIAFGNEAPAEPNDFDDNDNGLHLRKGNAIGTQAWDISDDFPKNKENHLREQLMTPYPPSFNREFYLQQPMLENEVQKYPPNWPYYNQPDAGGLKAFQDAEILQQQTQPYRYGPLPYRWYAGLSNYGR